MNHPATPSVDDVADAGDWLEILDGRQRGARVALTRGLRLTLGSAVGNDLRVLDTSVRPRHLALTVLEEGIELSALGGPIEVDGRRIETGRRSCVPPGVAWQVGERTLRCVRNGNDGACAGDATASDATAYAGPRDSESSSGFDRYVTASDGTVVPAPPVVERASTRTEASRSGHDMRSRRPIALRRAGSLIGLGLCAFAAYAWFSDSETGTGAEQRVREAVAGLELDSIAIDATRRPFVVTGFVASQADAMALDQALRRSGVSVATEITVGERVASRVADVLRVNGVNADISVPDAAHVRAATLGVTQRDWQRAWAAVRRDVPHVRRMEIGHTNQPVARRTGTTEFAPPRFDLDKQVALVVSRAPAHLVTHDRSRYFVGSLLPSGHRIVSIEDNRVALRKRDAVTTLQF